MRGLWYLAAACALATICGSESGRGTGTARSKGATQFHKKPTGFHKGATQPKKAEGPKAPTQPKAEGLKEKRARWDAADALEEALLARGEALSQHCTNDRYINVGLPKSGSRSIHCFFQCNGKTSLHWQDRMANGEAFHAGVAMNYCASRGMPILDCASRCYDAYSQIDYETKPPCHFPQITHLEGLVMDNPNATFLLPKRDSTEWYHSITNWGHARSSTLDVRLAACNLPTLDAPFKPTEARLRQFHADYLKRTRAILKRARELYGIRLIEFDIMDPGAGALLARKLPELQRRGSWTEANVTGCWGNYKHETLISADHTLIGMSSYESCASR